MVNPNRGALVFLCDCFIFFEDITNVIYQIQWMLRILTRACKHKSNNFLQYHLMYWKKSQCAFILNKIWFCSLGYLEREVFGSLLLLTLIISISNLSLKKDSKVD
jgi:hypothetical protein